MQAPTITTQLMKMMKKQGKAYCNYFMMQDMNRYVQQITSGEQ